MKNFLHRLGFWHVLMVRWLSIVATVFALAPTAVQAQVNFAGFLNAGPLDTYLATNLNDFPNTATAVDPAGNIYLCDLVTNQLFESLALGPSGFAPYSFSSYSSIPNPGVCAGPQKPPVLAIDAAGDILSANATQIQMAPKSQSGFGSLTVIASGFNNPTGIAVDNDGNVFVADSGNQQIVEIPKVARGYGSKVTIFGGENQLIGVAVDGAGNLYAAGGDGSGSGYVVKAVRTATGFDAPAQIASGLNFVNGLAVDAAGDVFVSSNANATPANFHAPSVINLWEIGITSSGYAPAIPLNAASSIAQGVSTDAQGNVYLHSVQNIFGTNDDLVTVGKPNSQPFGSIAVNGNPSHFGSVVNFWVTSPLAEPPSIALFNRGNPSADFSYQTTNQVFCGQSGPWAQAVYPVQCSIVVDFDPQYSGDRGAGILVSNDSGAPLSTAYLTGVGVGPQAAFDPGVPSTVASGLNPVQGTTVDGLGNVYIASSAGTGGASNGVVRVPTGADGYGAGSSVGKIPKPLGVSMDGLGNLFVIDGNTFNVYELPWTGSGFGAQQIVVDGRLLADPSAIAVDRLGNLYLTESSMNRVLVVPWLRTAFGEPQVINTSLRAPTGIAVDGEQNVYVVDQGNNRVVELPWIENHYGSQTNVISGLMGPTGIAVDCNHNLFVVNQSGSRVVQSAWSGTAYAAPTVIYTGAAESLANVSVDETDSLYIGVNTKTGTPDGSVIKLDRSVPALLNFASTPVGKTSVDSPKKVSVQNVGNQPLTFTSLLYPADFSMGVGDRSACTSTTTLAQGARCDLSVQYVPTVPGPVTESVTFTDNTTNIGGGQHSLTVSSSAQSLVPVIYPVSGFYSTPQLLTIVAPVAGAKIYFTQDGSTPSTSSTLYTAPVSIQTSQSVNAIAVVNGAAGPVVNAVYSFQLAATEVSFNSGIDATQLALNHGATVTGGVLQLTDGSPAEARSAWLRNLVPINTFTSDFTFQIQSPVADGFTFAIQDTGLDAVGSDSAGLGYQNIRRSVAVKFDLYNNQGEGNNSTGVFIDGAEPTVYSLTIPSTVNLHSGDVMHAHLSYDGAKLTLSLSDTVTGANFETVFPGTIDIPSIVGGNYAWVGFTGSTGGKTAIQTILSWTYSTGGSAGFAAQRPIISPASSLQSAPVTVKIQTTTQDGAIYYTLDGTVPTTASTLYTGPFVTNPEQIINAVTVAPGYAPSTESTAVYSDHTNNGFPGGASGFIFNGSASASSGKLIQLTNGGTGERSSAWAPNKLPVQSFSTDFIFQLLDPEADGFTLTFQNAGEHALGGSGAGLGYEGIVKSVALKFDLYNNAGEGFNSTGVFTGGATPPTIPALDLTGSGIDLHSGHLMHAWVEYDGAALALTLMDTVTQTKATQTFPVNIPAAVGGSEAWVGFTAGTGRLSAVQSILSWNYEY